MPSKFTTCTTDVCSVNVPWCGATHWRQKQARCPSTCQVMIADSDAAQAAAQGWAWTELQLREPAFDGSLSHSVFLVPSLASVAECEGLIAAAQKVSVTYEKLPGMFEVPGRQRMPVTASSAALRVHSRLLKRVLSFIESELPHLALTLFGQDTNLSSMSVSYSAGEPAVNIYTPGGEFMPHTDNEHLSVLIPLDAPGAYEGGGTAFWADDYINPGIPYDPVQTKEENDCKRRLPPAHLLKPAMGTAMLFGGSVVHAGLPVTCGTRHIFVMSLTLRRACNADRPSSFG